MTDMGRWEIYGTWGILLVIALGISSISRHLTEIQNEITEIHRKLSERPKDH
jgi:hypothetical protein